MRKILKFLLRMVIAIVVVLLLAWLVGAQIVFKFRTPDAEAEKSFAQKKIPFSIQNHVVNGRNIHFAVSGIDSLPTLLFIHGSPGSWNAFEAFMQDEDLLKKYRMISIDRPGFGYSDFGKSENLATESAMISPVINHLQNGRPIYLVGHSLGGPLLIKLFADHPDYFKSLVILAGSVDPSLEEKETWRKPLMYFPLEYFVPGAMRPSNKELWWLKTDLVDLKPDFAKITCPVYIVHGEQDNMVPVANADYSRKMLVNSPRVIMVMLPGANHFIPWTRFEEIKKLLLGM